MRTRRAWPAIAALLVLSCLVPARVAADTSKTLRARAGELQRKDADLSARSHSAVLDLYAFDSQLVRERAHVVALRTEAGQVQAARAAAEHRLASARRSLGAAERALALRLQQLYEQGNDDPLAVVLGASSVEEALNRLDTLNRAADADRFVIEQTRRARRVYETELRALTSREQRLAALAEDAARTARGLEQARAERASYLASLAATRRLSAAEISALERQARTIETRTSRLAAVASARGGGAVSAQGATLTVTATGYCLHGRTASGARAGWGVVAVDPSTIPLGTRMTIPGYGEGIAADTGSSVVGTAIDIWFPTRAQARAWGRRPVTITLH